MLLAVYVLIIIIACLLLAVSLKLASGSLQQKYGLVVTGLVMSMTLFAVLAFASLQITENFCENQTNQTVVSGNTTTYTNGLACVTRTSADWALAVLFGAVSLGHLLFIIRYSPLFES